MVVFAPFVGSYTPEPTRCSSVGARTGTAVLQDYICDGSATFAPDFTDLGIYACRDVYGHWCPDCSYANLSAHASGRAGDSGTTVKTAGDTLAAWLVANAAVLGIQEVIWYRRRWTNQTKAWRTYTGVSPHTDHVHWTLNESGARYLTLARVISVAPGHPVEEEDMAMVLKWFKGEAAGSTACYRVLQARVDADTMTDMVATWVPNDTERKALLAQGYREVNARETAVPVTATHRSRIVFHGGYFDNT